MKVTKYMPSIVIIVAAISIFILLSSNEKINTSIHKINGVSFVAPPRFIDQNKMQSIASIESNWVALTPYAFSKAEDPHVNYNYDNQWWGERPEGILKTIEYAQNLGLKVMLKPHVWVRSQGWAGDYNLANKEEWQQWFKDYKAYILVYASIAEKMNVELLCIGTEYKKAVVQHPELWIKLIKEIKQIYHGKLTYAANWDNYKNITFWPQLDFIGIDAYFPLSESKTSPLEELNNNWIPFKTEIKEFSEKHKKPILFTEYGYESRDFAADGHWKYNKDTLEVNLKAQENAYISIYSSFWNESWFSGGFVWKWHAQHDKVGGNKDKHYTPQNKPAEKIILQNNIMFK